MSENKPDLMAELAACPFCGGGAWVVDVPDTRRFRPQCSKCGADLGEFKRRADAVTAWNTRTHHAELEAGGRDKQRLDWLETMANKPGGLLLHDGSESGRCGLGLRPGAANRDLRTAIDQAMHNSAREG